MKNRNKSIKKNPGEHVERQLTVSENKTIRRKIWHAKLLKIHIDSPSIIKIHPNIETVFKPRNSFSLNVSEYKIVQISEDLDFYPSHLDAYTVKEVGASFDEKEICKINTDERSRKSDYELINNKNDLRPLLEKKYSKKNNTLLDSNFLPADANFTGDHIIPDVLYQYHNPLKKLEQIFNFGWELKDKNLEDLKWMKALYPKVSNSESEIYCIYKSGKFQTSSIPLNKHKIIQDKLNTNDISSVHFSLPTEIYKQEKNLKVCTFSIPKHMPKFLINKEIKSENIKDRQNKEINEDSNELSLLFRKFTDLEYRDESIEKFANSFGKLGISPNFLVSKKKVIEEQVGRGKDSKKGYLFYEIPAESLCGWYWQIFLLKNITEFYDNLLKLRDLEKITNSKNIDVYIEYLTKPTNLGGRGLSKKDAIIEFKKESTKKILENISKFLTDKMELSSKGNKLILSWKFSIYLHHLPKPLKRFFEDNFLLSLPFFPKIFEIKEQSVMELKNSSSASAEVIYFNNKDFGTKIGKEVISMTTHQKTYAVINFYEDIISKILKHILSFQLEKRIFPTVAANKTDISDSLQPKMIVNTKLVPNSLLAFLWLQFSKSVTKSEINLKCEECGTWFIPERKTNLIERVGSFCSSSCRRSNEHLHGSFEENNSSKKPFGRLLDSIHFKKKTLTKYTEWARALLLMNNVITKNFSERKKIDHIKRLTGLQKEKIREELKRMHKIADKKEIEEIKDELKKREIDSIKKSLKKK